MRRVFSFPLGTRREGKESEVSSSEAIGEEVEANSPSSSSTKESEVDFEDGLEQSHVGSLVKTARGENRQ